jgi:hypothetical protein
MKASPTTDLFINALLMAVWGRRPAGKVFNILGAGSVFTLLKIHPSLLQYLEESDPD